LAIVGASWNAWLRNGCPVARIKARPMRSSGHTATLTAASISTARLPLIQSRIGVVSSTSSQAAAVTAAVTATTGTNRRTTARARPGASCRRSPATSRTRMRSSPSTAKPASRLAVVIASATSPITAAPAIRARIMLPTNAISADRPTTA
jgi:hypothetical protein